MTPDERATGMQSQIAADKLKLVLRSSRLSDNSKLVLEQEVDRILNKYDDLMERHK